MSRHSYHRQHPFFMAYAYASLGVAVWVVTALYRIA